MKLIARYCWRNILIGTVVLIPLFFSVILLGWLWSGFAWLTVDFVGSAILNFLIKIGIILGLSFVVGMLASLRWFRNLILGLVSKIPLIGTIAVCLLNHEFIERLKKGELQEAMFMDIGGRWGFGIVVNEFRAPQDTLLWSKPEQWDSSRLIDWCVVLGPPTAPLAATAQMWYCPKRMLVFNGRTAKDTTITAASLGFIFRFPKIDSERER